MRLLLALSLMLTPLVARADEPSIGSRVYKQTLPAVVWIQSARKNGSTSGSGSLVDAERGLVLTNYHVVEDNPRATVFFPLFRDGKAVAEKSYYRDRAARLGVAARVVVASRTTDLAVLQLERVPEGVTPLALADQSPDPGDTVHSVGNAGRSGALWGYVRGTVRQVYRKKWHAELSGGRRQVFEAKVVETDSPTNPGDSGGPLLTDAGRLVGVTQGGAVDAQSVSFFIDVSEVRKILESREVLAVRRDAKIEPEKPATIAVSDVAGIFSKDAIEKANALLAEAARAGRPVRVETLKVAPESLTEKLADANPAERRKVFEEYAFGRLKETKTDGAILLICMKPSTAVVVLTNPASRRYPEGTAKKAAQALLGRLKESDFDGALLDTLKLLSDAKPAKADD